MIQASPSDPAVLLIGHGTRRPASVAEFHALVEQLQQALPQRTLLAGFLELTDPSLAEVLETLRQQGFRPITALPAFLMAAGQTARRNTVVAASGYSLTSDRETECCSTRPTTTPCADRAGSSPPRSSDRIGC